MSKKRIFHIITGQSGTGKSYLLKNYVIPNLANRKPVIIFDLMNEYQNIADHIHGSFEDFYTFTKDNGDIRGINCIKWKKKSDIIKGLRFVEEMRVPMSVVLDEAHTLYNSRYFSACRPSLESITLHGRHYNVDTILSTQRPIMLDTTARSQADFITSFYQQERRDVDYLRQMSEKFGQVAELQKHHYITVEGAGKVPAYLSKLNTQSKL